MGVSSNPYSRSCRDGINTTRGVQKIDVTPNEAELRLDQWFKRRFPELTFGRIAKWLRTGQVRVDGKRSKPGDRLHAGQTVRVPPFAVFPAVSSPPIPVEEAETLRARVLHCDARVIALNKPANLAVQGGSKVQRHLDGMLDALRFDAKERPLLVHRLDKDTSGVLLLARDQHAAKKLTAAFKNRETEKIYWALVVGVPRPRKGRIDLAVAKRSGRGGEKMAVDQEGGKPALTEYAVINTAGSKVAWLELRPFTGRTHQLRVHMVSLGTPILGDGKYGGQRAFIPRLSERLHLHARSIAVPHPDGGVLRVTSPLGYPMAESWATLGFDEDPEHGDSAIRSVHLE